MKDIDLPFVTLDVFSDRPFSGNPLAVFPQAEELDDTTMQAIATEMNLSETVFITGSGEEIPRLRIFTPKVELPFAGHPTIGAAFALAGRRDRAFCADFRMETNMGIVQARVSPDADGAPTVWIVAPGIPQGGSVPEPAVAAAVLGILDTELVHAPEVWGVGVPMTFIAVADRTVLSRAATEMTVWNATFRGRPGHQLYVFTMDDWINGQDVYARVFAPGIGIAEDPATGGGAVALVGMLQGLAGVSEGQRRWTIHQGLEMGRPSRLLLDAEFEGGFISSIRLGGTAVPMTQGRLRAPDKAISASATR